MPSFPYDDDIAVNRLLFDERNPRVPDGTSGQRDALLRLAEHQGAKLLSLAAHIAGNGLNPAQRFIVIPKGKDFVVLDGNRRLSAMKALDTPSAITTLSTAQTARLKRLSDKATIPDTIRCVVFRDAIEAEPWVRLTHLTQRGGVGQSKWSAVQKARHEERLDPSAKPQTLQILDFVRNAGALSQSAADVISKPNFALTIVERMLETKGAKELLGIEMNGNVVSTRYPREQALRGLSRFFEDIAAGRINTRTHNTSKERMEYLGKFTADELPDPTTKGADLVSLEDALPGGTAKRRPAKKKDRPSSGTRTYVIPDDFMVSIPDRVRRIHDIYLELKMGVRVEETANAAGALLRVFLEMSLWDYCTRNNLGTKGHEALTDNYSRASKHILAKDFMAQPAMNAVHAAIFAKGSGITTIQAFMHNPDFPLAPIEIRRVWDRLQPLFTVLWL